MHSYIVVRYKDSLNGSGRAATTKDVSPKMYYLKASQIFANGNQLALTLKNRKK